MTPLSQHLESILNEAERRALVAVIRARPELTLEKLQDCFGGRYGETLRTITVGELIELGARIGEGGHAKFDQLDPLDQFDGTNGGARFLGSDGGPPIDRAVLALAKRSNGVDFDLLVHDAIAAAEGRSVSASYLRARVGGPRWKLQGSLRRLAESGQIERSGVTSSTRYRVFVPNSD